MTNPQKSSSQSKPPKIFPSEKDWAKAGSKSPDDFPEAESVDNDRDKQPRPRAPAQRERQK